MFDQHSSDVHTLHVSKSDTATHSFKNSWIVLLSRCWPLHKFFCIEIAIVIFIMYVHIYLFMYVHIKKVLSLLCW